jgi:simple sugar transport system substrate-binding protein
VIQGINAFALGMRAANPKASVRLLWLDTWFDPTRERAAAQTLIDQGADVLTHHSGSPAVAQAAQANFRSRGVRVIPYPSDMRAYAPEPSWLRSCTAGAASMRASPSASSPAPGRPSRSGAASAAAWSTSLPSTPALPQDVRAALASRRAAIVEGRFKPFGGRLVDNRGNVRLATGALDDARIRSMDWLVEGVVGQLPAR